MFTSGPVVCFSQGSMVWMSRCGQPNAFASFSTTAPRISVILTARRHSASRLFTPDSFFGYSAVVDQAGTSAGRGRRSSRGSRAVNPRRTGALISPANPFNTLKNMVNTAPSLNAFLTQIGHGYSHFPPGGIALFFRIPGHNDFWALSFASNQYWPIGLQVLHMLPFFFKLFTGRFKNPFTRDKHMENCVGMYYYD